MRPRPHQPPQLGSAASHGYSVTGEEAREIWRTALAAPTGARRRARGVGVAPSGHRAADDEDGAAVAGGRRRRIVRQPAAVLGTERAAHRLIMHMTGPRLWEPGVT